MFASSVGTAASSEDIVLLFAFASLGVASLDAGP